MKFLNRLDNVINIFGLPMQDNLLENSFEKSVVEQHDGTSNYDTNLLYEIETNGAQLSDLFWFENKEQILQLEKQGLVESLDIGGHGQLGESKRTLKLTPKGRLAMLIGQRESTNLKF